MVCPEVHIEAGSRPRVLRVRSLSATPSCEFFTSLQGSQSCRAGVVVSCLLELSADKASQSRWRGQHLPPQVWALLDTQKKLGGVGQWEVKVCTNPVSSAIDPAGFFLGGGGGICFVFFT